MLSAGAGMEEFRKVLTHAYRAGASGYLAGRAIWLKAFEHFPDWDAMRSGLRGEALDYMRSLNALTASAALPWQQHSCYGPGGPRVLPADASFRHVYPGFGG
jgi:tagatose 1,6-diphosphate aldolase